MERWKRYVYLSRAVSENKVFEDRQRLGGERGEGAGGGGSSTALSLLLLIPLSLSLCLCLCFPSVSVSLTIPSKAIILSSLVSHISLSLSLQFAVETLTRSPPPKEGVGSLRRASCRELAVMSKSCKGLLDELVKCLSESNCVTREGKTHAECAAVNDTKSVPARCLGIRATYAKCKLGQLDMRSRIRGNKGY